MGMRQLKIVPTITNRESQSLEKYFSEISKVDIITTDEEVVLARRIKAGDQEALNSLTKANLRFVVSVAKQYQFQGLSLSDLINEGNIGLIKAAQRFNETKGFKFISYAVWWIRQTIIQAIAEQGNLVHLPANKTSLSVRIHKTISVLEQELERSPTTEELADRLDVNVNEVRITRSLHLNHTSLDTPLGQDGDGTLLDTIVNTSASTDAGMVHHYSLSIEIKRSLEVLTKMEKEVILFFFGIGIPQSFSLQEIGDKYDLTKERVRQIKDKALTKLRAPKKSDLLRTYLGA